jgi:HEAT repeat protein
MKIGRQGQDALAAAAGSQDPELRTAVRSAMKEINQRKAEEEKRKRAAADDSKYQREMKDSQDARERFVEKHGPPRPLPPELPKPAERVPERKDIDGLSPARIMKMGQADLSKVPVQDTGAGRKEKAPPVDAKRLEEINRAIAEFHKATGLTPGEVPRGAGAGKEAKKEKPKSPATEENLPDEGPEKMYSGLGAPGGTLPSRISRSSLKDAVRKQTQTLDEAIRALKNPDPVIRAAAIEALRVFGDTGREEIKKALSDADPRVRETAADALGEIGDEFCVPLLVALIRDSEGGVRIAAIKALGKLGDLRVIPYLINCFSDEYHVVRHVAADTLVQMGEEAIPALILCLDDELPIKRMTAVRALGKFRHPGVIAPLIRKIGDPDPEMRRAVAQALGTIGEPAIDPLEMVLHAGTKYERLGALDALGYMIADRVKEVIEQALKDPDMEVRFRAEQVLKKRDTLRLWSRAWAEQLQKETERAKPPVTPEAEKPVPPPPDEKTEVTQLINSLRSDDRQTQISSAFKLMVLGRPAVEGLLNALKSEDPQIHALASEVIGEMRDVAVDPLMDALNDKTRLVRLVAARNLGRIGNVRALDALTESLARETDPGVRATVAEALGYMGDKQAIAQLSRAMRDRDEQVQIAAARSLGYIGGIRAIGPLIQALNDVDEYIRRAALIALRDPEGHVQEHLVVALRKGDRSFVQGVADALDRTGWSPKDPLDHAYYLIAKEHWGELEQIGPVALRPLREMLDDPDTEVRIEVVKTIARIGGPETIPLLLHALRDRHFMIRRRAEQALVDMGELAREALSPLKSLDNPEYERIIRKIEARKVKRSGEPEYESGN